MKITPQQESALRGKVHEAVGTASVCWEPKPEGVFQTEIALAVGTWSPEYVDAKQRGDLGFEIEWFAEEHDRG